MTGCCHKLWEKLKLWSSVLSHLSNVCASSAGEVINCVKNSGTEEAITYYTQ